MHLRQRVKAKRKVKIDDRYAPKNPVKHRYAKFARWASETLKGWYEKLRR